MMYSGSTTVLSKQSELELILLRELLLVLRPIPQFPELEMVKKLEVDSLVNPKPRLLPPPFCRNIPAAAELMKFPDLTFNVI